MGSTKQRNRVNIGSEERTRESSRMRVNNTAAEGSGSLAGLENDDLDALGHVNSGGLAKGLIQASLATVALLAVFTVGPYFMPETKKATTDKKATQPVPNEVAIDPTKSATDVANSAPSTDQQKAAAHMGLSDTKAADPASNPLEKKSDIDSLLDID